MSRAGKARSDLRACRSPNGRLTTWLHKRYWQKKEAVRKSVTEESPSRSSSGLTYFWGFAPDTTDWTVRCPANWSWHPDQPAPVVEKNKPQSTFYKDVPSTKLQEKTCGLSALPWRPNSTAANRNWERRRHSSPERPWSCRLRTPRRRRRLVSDDNRKLSVMAGTLLYVFGPCERHSKFIKEVYIPFRPIPKEYTLRHWLFYKMLN